MAKTTRYTIRRRSFPKPAGYRHAEKVTNPWEKKKFRFSSMIIYIIITAIVLILISVGLYFLITKIKEDFGIGNSCPCVNKPEKLQTEKLQTEKLQTEELQTEKLQTEELQTEELQTEELQTEELQTEELQTEELI